MSEKPSAIRNLGPASDVFFGRAGISTADQLRDLGPDEAYFRALQAGGQPHFIGYYAMVMGLQGRPWNDCQGKEKAELRARFDALKAQATAPKSDMERILDKIGVITPPSRT